MACGLGWCHGGTCLPGITQQIEFRGYACNTGQKRNPITSAALGKAAAIKTLTVKLNNVQNLAVIKPGFVQQLYAVADKAAIFRLLLGIATAAVQ